MTTRHSGLMILIAPLALTGSSVMAQQYSVVDTGQTVCYDDSNEIACPAAGESFHGQDAHGAGAVRFDTKVEGGPLGEGGERYFNYVRCVRDE